MIRSYYTPCRAIEIVGWQGKAIDQGREMTRVEYLPFEQRMLQLLDKIKGTSSGRLLFRSLDATNKIVRIHSGNDWDDNAAKMDPNIASNGTAASIQTFRPAHHNVELALKGSERAWRGEDPNDNRSVQKANIKLQLSGLGQKTTKVETAPILAAVLNRTHLGMTLDPPLTKNRFQRPMQQLPQRLGISPTDFDDMVHGLKYMPDAVYYPLCFLLYDYMLPGAGTNAQIRAMNKTTYDHDFKNDMKAENKLTRSNAETSVRLDATILAHELIHAWRMMAGRRVVAGGWEEEAMTSGIGPFSNWRLTENCFRSDFGLSTRKIYANNRHSSELMQTIHNQVSNTGYHGVMF